MKRAIRCKTGLVAIIPMVIFVVLATSIFVLPAAGWEACSVFGCPENSLPGDPGKFNGLWWGQYLGELQGMKLASYDPGNYGELYYTHHGDILQLGDAKLEYVQYGFWKGLYSSLVFGTKGIKNWRALKSICFENYRPWHQPDWRVERYIWVGNHSAMTLEYDEAMSEGQLYVYSKAIYERQLADKRRATGERPHKNFWLY